MYFGYVLLFKYLILQNNGNIIIIHFLKLYFVTDEKNVMTCIARYTRPINGTSKGSGMWLIDFPHCSSMSEGIYIILILL